MKMQKLLVKGDGVMVKSESKNPVVEDEFPTSESAVIEQLNGDVARLMTFS